MDSSGRSRSLAVRRSIPAASDVSKRQNSLARGAHEASVSPSPSRPGEFHPEPLTPDVSLSTIETTASSPQLPGPDRANFRAAYRSDGADQEPGTSCSSVVLPIALRSASSRPPRSARPRSHPARSTCPHRLDPLQHLPLSRWITVRLAPGGDGSRQRTQNSASRGCRCRAPRRHPQRLQRRQATLV